MHRSELSDYVIARFHRAMQLHTPIHIFAREHATLLGCSTGAVLARLYRAGVLGSQRPMFYSDEQICAAYAEYLSMDTVARELGASFYSVRAALRRKGIHPVGNRRTRERRLIYRGPGTPKSVCGIREY